jgi:hypothetical protein
VDSQQLQRFLRSSITPEERKNVSLVLAALVDEALKDVDIGMIMSVLVKLAILVKSERIGGGLDQFVDMDLKALGISEIIDLYVAHRPEEYGLDG